MLFVCKKMHNINMDIFSAATFGKFPTTTTLKFPTTTSGGAFSATTFEDFEKQ